MSQVKWIKITTDMFDDEKIKLIEAMPERDTILIIWVKLLSQAGKCNASGHLILNDTIPYTDEMLSTIFNRPLSSIRMALATFKQFGMIECEESIKITNWQKHQNIEGLEKIREQNRIRKQRERERKKEQEQLKLSEVNMSRDMSHDITQQNKNKNKNKNIKDNSEKKPSASLINSFFEDIWKLYPNKKGKGSISKTQKNKLFKIGVEELTRAIERYNKEITDIKYMKHGSTFFNSGYIDYLDENYQQQEQVNSNKQQEKVWVIDNDY